MPCCFAGGFLPCPARLTSALLAAFLGAACLGADPLPQPPAQESFSELPLRGYGPLAGQYRRDDAGGGGSSLAIACSDQAHARLTAAKYARDLEAMNGILPAALAPVRRAGAVWEVPGQGWLALQRRRSQLAILVAPDQGALAALARRQGWAPAEIDEQLVPAWLDAWDRHGFRFYYRPWEAPKVQATGKDLAWKDYPVLDEFDFASRTDSGFVFWAGPDENDTGPALSNRPWWDWGAAAAARRGLPFVVNTSHTIPTWLLNRSRDQVQMNAPQYCGSYHSVAQPWSAGMRQLSWCATTGEDAALALIQRTVRDWASSPQTLEWLEPHGELEHGAYDLLLEYGPLADASYRRYLGERYDSPQALSKRWFGNASTLRSWDEVRVPELAEFLGWGPQALDLTGEWRLRFESRPDAAGGPAWYEPAFADDSWSRLLAPGNDRLMFLPKTLAQWRRSLEVPAAWLAAGERTWLYVWDLNFGGPQPPPRLQAYCNGQPVGDDALRHAVPHWGAFEITKQVRPGSNLLALSVPQGYLGYRVYLSHQPPRQYPALGPGDNARWVDFCDWRRWTRLETCRRGIEAIRQVDPDRSIVCMAPDAYFADIRELCQRYGAHFHNTGHMGGFWNDYLPMLMRGADLPFSLEPGGPARDLPGFKSQLGRYFTEGIQAIHYFIHIGNIYWPEDLRAHFERIQPLLKTIGKVHPPKAQAAMLFSNRADSLSSYPWGSDYNTNLPTGYWGWRFSDSLASSYHLDAVTDMDFAPGGPADAYCIVIDTNTAVMSTATVAAIAGWVRRGGIFVTTIQTGRHTPEQADAWPIAALTGYRVTAIDPHHPSGSEGCTRSFRPVPGQEIVPAAAWPADKNFYANGLSLEKLAPEATDLAQWQDGTVAIGKRPLGKGFVIDIGVKFGSGRGGGGSSYAALLGQVLDWAGIARLPAQADGVMLRHYVSNNGLFDVWTLWNQDAAKTVATKLRFSGPAPACYDLLSGQALPASGALELPPLETRIYVSARTTALTAPRDWFVLQRGWWRGTQAPAGPALKLPERPFELDLTGGWAYRVLADADPVPEAELAPDCDDTAWPRRPLNCWAVGEELPSRHVLFRRRFTVPAAWQQGELTLWLRSYFSTTVAGTARFWLDGQPLGGGDGRYGLIQGLALAPGSSHLLAVEIKGEGQVCGVRGNTWLSFLPAPRARLDLAGPWFPSRDSLAWDKPLTLPGPLAGAKNLRRTVRLPTDWAGGQVCLYLRGGYAITGVLVNGRYLRRHHHALGETTFLNLTPWLRPGTDNEIEVLAGGGKQDRLDAVELRLYKDATEF